MATTRTVDFLPPIFQTDANKQFLSATLDQLVQEPKFKKTQGFIGRTVGPGVNPNDKYVVEPTTNRANYQLEPGVISLVPDTDQIQNAITYPGINDAIGFYGGNQTRPDRLYESEYYSWDPFVDFDTFVNFSQYFWLPAGPDAVDVAATGIPATDNFNVTRANGVYTFSGLTGDNPVLELVRGGTYTFQVAQNNKETVNYRVQNQGTTGYKIDYQLNPTLTLARGNTYVFDLSLNGIYPFWIKTVESLGLGDTYNSGVTRNGATSGLITFTVPQDAPDVLYYVSQTETNMRGVLNIVNSTSGTGPGFWIQSAPGVTGTLPTAPNISSRTVLGVTNNGEDLGTVTFNVPNKTDQQFYYDLTTLGTAIDMISTLKYDQINNMPLLDFIVQYGGIDGNTYLTNKTLVFDITESDPTGGGWLQYDINDPLAPPTVIPFADRYQIWTVQIVKIGGIDYIKLVKTGDIPIANKFTIQYGNTYSTTSWYKDDLGFFQRIPLLTAAQDTLYYQDGTDPEIFGRIRLIELTGNTTLDVDQIIGKKNYTSPNGVVFTNGLKVIFRGDVIPVSYQNQAYYVSGVGSAIELLPEGNFITPETYVVDEGDSSIATEPTELDYLTISRASKDLNAWTRSNRWFHIDVINATAEYNNTVAVLDNNFRAKRPIIQFRAGIRLFNMGTSGKQPVDIIDFTEADAFSNVEGRTSFTTDGYTLVEGSRVIFAADEDQNVRDKIYVVTFIVPNNTPSTTAGAFQIGCTYAITALGNTDWNIAAGTTGETYAVGDSFVAATAGSGTGTAMFSEPVINLVLADDYEVLADNSLVVLNGATELGKTFWYDGSVWYEAQQKSSVQQAPLFNVYDSDDVSFGDGTKYTSTTFTGSKLFSYAVGDTSLIDPVLKFPLQYLNINNVGDIVFENNLYKDSFYYVVDNVSVTIDISSGHVQEYADRTAFAKEIGWQTAATVSQQRQQFKFTYTGQTLKLDIKAESDDVTVPALKLYVGSQFQDPSTYTYYTTVDSTVITLLKTYLPTDVIEVAALSKQTSNVGFYQVPLNLESNPLNGNSDQFTLGTIRTHYESICQNLTTIAGKINGPNNSRDLGNIIPYGLVILQQSSPLTLTGYFLRSDAYNIFASLQYNAREYNKYKNQMLEAVTKQYIQFQTASQILDTAIEEITQGKLETQPFYWSDMVPSSANYTATTYTVTPISTDIFDTVQIYNYKSANYLGMNVYLNNELLTRGLDYVVATDGPRITVLAELSVGDVILIQEYSQTYGNFCPNTPTKLGLYAAWRPEIVEIRGTSGVDTMIRGHDGSLTLAFGDIRDEVLLEFEKRIFNNLKLDGNPVPLTEYDVLPGQFRDTGYAYTEVNDILSTDFLSYCGWNKLDYKTQNYLSSNEFSFNYSSSQNVLTPGETLLGAWRGINRYFYDTQQPQLWPWEMLGFTIKPDWWENVYGAGPYTGENMILWDDLAAGYVADPIAPYFKPEFARPASVGSTTEIPKDSPWAAPPYPSLSPVIPTGTSGELLPPFDVQMSDYNPQSFQKSWQVGDGGPVEASWWNSSSYPFAVMHLLAVTRPAKFFALFADRDLYKYNKDYGQYLYNDRYRLDANGIEVYGNGVSKASYINWIVDYNRQTGLDSTETLTADLKNLDVRLCYRMASFSDKQYIKLYTEKSSPNSTNTTLLIPDESYNLLLYKNQPFDRASYTSVVIQKVSGGYAVFGYSTTQPYFDILASQATGKFKTYSAGGTSVQVPTIYTDNVVQVPYGFIFSNEASVADFLLSYGKLLETQGLTFTDQTNGYILDWSQMVQEFLYWSNQGWNENALINLNPLAFKLSLTKPQAIVDSIRAQTVEDILLDQNKRELPTRNLNIVRLENTFTVEPLTDQTLSFIDLRYTSYEHMIVLNNQSVFGDLIYAPITGARQSRLVLVAATSTDWNGSVNAPGFILNRDNIEEWTGLRRYTKGEIVKYKNVYWSASAIVQPSAKFNYSEWYQSDYNQIQLGLLPNIANKADQLANSYNINTANLESDNDLLSYGLIGFRPRQYMAALNLDDVSQVNVYRQFLDSKGTILSAELFSIANLGKEAGDYSIYENWGVQRSVYGANANRSFVDLRLNRALLDANPSVVQVVNPNQVTQADQAILLSDVWRQSYKLSSPDFLPTTTDVPTDTALPSAGYVNFGDADITVFNLDDPASLAANIDSINVGTTIWVAKVNNYDWGIFRAVQVPGVILHVCDNLDDTSRVIFSQQHGLSVGDKLIIRFFDSEVNGVYTVAGVPSLDTVHIIFQFAGDRTVANGTGIGFTLQTERVAQASDIINLPYVNNIIPGAKVWADDNGLGNWEVLEKQDVFTATTALSPLLLDATEQYGQSIAQARNRYATLVGSPRYGFGSGYSTGGVYTYLNNYVGDYVPVSPFENADAILTLDVKTSIGSGIPAARGYGNDVDFGNQAWAVAGASGSLGSTGVANTGYAAVIYRDPTAGQAGTNPYVQWQLLTPPGTTPSTTTGAGEFGYSVAMSLDERWMYISAPGINQVHAYGYVDWQDQVFNAAGDGVTKDYNVAATIQFSTTTQIKVLLNGTVQAYGTDYTIVSGTIIRFTNAPAVNALVKIERISLLQLDYNAYYEVTQSATSGAGVNAEFTIVRQRGEVGQPGATAGTVGVTNAGTGYAIGNTVTIAAASFAGGNNITVTVTGINGTGGITSMTWAYTPPALVSVFNLSNYLFTVNNIYSFSVIVDGVLNRPNIDYTYNANTGSITFAQNPVAGAAIIVRAKGYFEYVNTLTASNLSATDRFGHSVACSTDGQQVIIGCKNVTINGKLEAGAAYVFNRNVQRFIYGQDPSSVAFTVLGTVTAPVTVSVNSTLLVNEVNGIINAQNTFAWNGSDTITVNTDLVVGDVVEIETNQFAEVQVVTQNTVEEFSNFGQAVDLCVYNCSLYAAAPQSSEQIFKGGIVERSVNQSRLYGTITATVANPTLTAGSTLRVNNQDVAVPMAPNNTVAKLAEAINNTVPNVSAVVSSTGYLTISVKNSDAAPAGNKLQVAPGSVGAAFWNLGFKTYAYTQTIYNPYPLELTQFGYAINIDDNATTLTVGSPTGTVYIQIEWDDGSTFFDADTTVFFSLVFQSGVVYTYNYFPSANESIANPGKFAFGQQITSGELNSYDNFGTAVNYTSGVLLVGAPGNDVNDSSSSDFGRVFLFDNPNNLPAWKVIREEKPVVDIRLLNSVFFYNRLTSAKTEFLDFFNPLQGKILGAARQNIDYIGAVDPASYNIGPVNVRGTTWGSSKVGQVWWDTSTIRFIDPNQDDIIYAAKRWGQIFPGSTADVYQWILSPVPPVDYTGPGTVHNINSYAINTRLSNDGTFATEYYFWVKGLTTVATQLGKTLSVSTVSQYIENPRASGIPYIAPINASTIGIFNSGEYIEAQDTVIEIEYDRELTNNNVHVEYELIQQDRPDGFLSANLYRKFQDSFCGVDTFGNIVPDPNLSIAERYGVQFRPRQSMFVDRFVALKNYLKFVNSKLVLYPISENRTFNLLNSSEPELPATSGSVTNWNLRVANLDILSYQDIYAVQLGYKYLVVSDSNNRGLWTIYTVEANPSAPAERILVLTRVQLYYTPDYWSYINWYQPGYNSSTRILAEVPNYSLLDTLALPVGSSVKVTANAQGKWEIYLRTATTWERVGLQDGTIEFSAELWDYALGRFGFDVEVFDAQYFDQEPVTETRKIIQAINEELLVDDLAIERNRALVLMFNFVLSEFSAPEWLVKTSLIDVDHNIRALIPYQNYVRDNQEFVSDYIQEVKPYHVQVREFNLTYNGADDFAGDLTDFDVPAYYDTSLEVPQYISPILLPYAHSSYQVFNTVSDAPANSAIWTAWPYSQWIAKYLLTLESIEIINGGTNYTEPPTIIINGDATTPATGVAVLNSSGQVVAVNITDQGSGYRSTPTIVFDGGNGSGARAYAVMNYNSQTNQYTGLARSLKTTIKYDRYQYQTTIQKWVASTTYNQGTLVRYNNAVWSANSTINSPTFDLENWTPVPANDLSGVDRTMGYYVPGVNEPGLEIPLLIDGTSYPGVQVWGDYFLGSNPLGPAVTCTATSSANNAITCETTLGLALDAPVKFIGNVFGNLQRDTVYYVKTIVDVTRFTVSLYAGGSEFVLSTATGTMLARIPQLVDADYESAFTDTYLGTRFTDINVDGGEFIGVREGYAPEELVNGAEYDTLDMRVYTRPGSDWQRDGHGFQIGNIRHIYNPALTDTYSWAGVVHQPVQVIVSNATSGLVCSLGIDYTVNWADETITIVNGFQDGQTINITVCEFGGGSELFRENYVGSDVGDTIIVPVQSTQIYEIAVFVDGNQVTPISWVPYATATTWVQVDSYVKLDVVTDGSNYYRALQDVPGGIAIDNTAYWFAFVPAQESKVTLPADYTSSDRVSIAVLGTQVPQYSWSTPITQYFVVDAAIQNSKTVTVDASMGGTNPANMVVNVNGRRLQPYEGIEWFGDDSSVEFGLPQRGSYSQSLINAPTDIFVWVDNVLQQQNYGSISTGSYSVTNWTGSNTPGRQVQFIDPPAAGARILVAVSTIADMYVVGNNVQIVTSLNIGDIVSVTTYNDTAQLNALTKVFIGPIENGVTITEPYDSTPFDEATTSYDPGSYDYTLGTSVPSNDFDLGRSGIDGQRLWVTLNGYRLFEGLDYTISGQFLILSSGPISGTDKFVITELTDSFVPEATGFRIFQDMRGVQATYRMTTATTTYLVEALSATGDIAYVNDANSLSQPDLAAGIFGVCTINGERIMYRERNIVSNTISGLRRGTAGTGAAAHAVDSIVYDMSRGNLLAESYQDYIVSDSTLGDGSTTIFYAPNISIDPAFPGDSSSAYIDHSIEVYVGGIRQYPIGLTPFGDEYESQYRYTVMDVSPVAIEFIVGGVLTAPAAGSEVTILQRRGKSWYNVGLNTPATAIQPGEQWWIVEVGTTDFTAIGADRNEVGVFFTATGTGSGTGLVRTASDGKALQETDNFAARFLNGN